MDVIFKQVGDGSFPDFIPVAELLPLNQQNTYCIAHPALKPIGTPMSGHRKEVIDSYVDTMAAAIFREFFAAANTPMLPQHQKEYFALKQEIYELESMTRALITRILDNVKVATAHDKARDEAFARRKPVQLSKEEEETVFQLWQESKETLTVSEYLTALHIDKEEHALYEGVRRVYLYFDETAIFEMIEGEAWEYDSFQATSKRYAFLNDYDLTENDQLAKVEAVAFKDMLTNATT